MSPEEAIQLAVRRFPFKGYMVPKTCASGSYYDIATTVIRHLAPGSTILDFGCGPGDKTSILQFLGFKCSGYDDLQDYWHKIPGNREEIMSFAKDCGFDFWLAKEGPLPFEKNSFDMIMLHDVIEHLHDSPRDLLNDLLELAQPEGLLFITVPNAVNIRKRIDVFFGRTNLPSFDGYYWYPGPWRGHIREYVRDDLIKLSEYLKLEVLELKSCDHMLQKLPAAFRPFYRLITNIFTGWKDSWLLVARKKQNWSPRKTLSDQESAKIIEKSMSYKFND